MSEELARAREIQTAKEIGALQEGQKHLQAADLKHDEQYQRLESKIDRVDSSVAEKLESMRKDMNKAISDALATAAMNAAELVISRAREDGILSRKSKALPVREFIENRPITAVTVAAASPPVFWQLIQFMLTHFSASGIHP